MNAFPPPAILMIRSVVVWFVLPVAMLGLVAVAASQPRLLNRSIERLLRLIADRKDRKA